MKRAYLVIALAVAFVAAGAGAFAYTKPWHTAAERSKAPKKLPGVTVNLVGCAVNGGSVNCLAIFKGRCVLVGFTPTGAIKGAQPVDGKYCGL